MIGNPPWGASIEKRTREYLTDQFKSATDFESSQYFLSLAETLVISNGKFGFILPNTFALNVYAKKSRSAILERGSLTSIVDLSEVDVFAGPNVRSLILIFERIAKANCLISNFSSEFEVKVMREESWSELYNAETWKRFLTTKNEASELVDRITSHGIFLSQFADVKQGYIPYRRTTLTKRFGASVANEILTKRSWHSKDKKSNEYFMEVQGADVSRYALNWSGTWVKYGPWVSTYLPLTVFSGPRILIREITGKWPYVLQATYTDSTYVHNPSVLAVLPKDSSIDIFYLLGILNSRLMSFVFLHLAPKAKKGLFPKIIITDAKRLPYPMLELNNKRFRAIYSELVSLAKEQILLCQPTSDNGSSSIQKRQITSIDGKIDLLVYQLYNLTEEEIKIVEGE